MQLLICSLNCSHRKILLFYWIFQKVFQQHYTTLVQIEKIVGKILSSFSAQVPIIFSRDTMRALKSFINSHIRVQYSPTTWCGKQLKFKHVYKVLPNMHVLWWDQSCQTQEVWTLCSLKLGLKTVNQYVQHLLYCYMGHFNNLNQQFYAGTH